uniref:Uncharacterized protein n=1 Tax=Strongyloides venezuelensis TaxID=75913 RepID=A0A0K0FD62_STRVS
MAPPKIVNLSLDNCPNRKYFSKWLRLMKNHLSEDERVLKLSEKEIAELEVKSEPSSILVNKLFNVKFVYKADNACCRLINDFESAACFIVSENCQEEIFKLFFVYLIPVCLKRELCLDQELPFYEKISSFARLQDVQFKHTLRKMRSGIPRMVKQEEV